MRYLWWPMENRDARISVLSQILTVPQAAAQLQVSERTIYEWLREGKLPGRKIGKVWRLSAQVLNEFMRGPHGDNPVAAGVDRQ
ncbi:MAG: helix-turn-helix domain-containing protein [Deltaproteobacteria bacterium]|nr:helix-turn-helix domain-containing protein [Deltaproteobacteria bacterium]